MLKIFSEVSAIEDIYVSDNYPNWQKVIGNQANIYLNIDQASLVTALDGDDDEESILFMWYHENDAAKRPEALGAQFQYANNEELMIDEPYGIFILDVSEEKANELSMKYGIQIYSAQNLVDIQDFEIDFDFEENETIQCPAGKLKGFQFVLDSFKSEKSNSTIIVDRNLFSNEEKSLNLGIDNMIRYFDTILPTTLDAPYEILFVTENSRNFQLKPNIRDRVIKDLTKHIVQLREYYINIEVLLVHSSTVIFKHTHQRRILKNYHFGNSEHGFAIFSIINPEKIKNDNDFNLQAHYHSLLKEQTGIISIKKRNKLFNRLMEIKTEAEKQLNKQGQNDRYYRLFLNGDESTVITNRLLN
ncbi:hypothetical protein [Labilibaculum manganireducens]|uniref:hypothetical protein n=1 Tax=Labilibaculum manganireducens TaxID=1940525 RepID=UPI0029F5A354|nr:hypothetical protein [Labilibaculum manganireducens]